jgi:hypothetical protein
MAAQQTFVTHDIPLSFTITTVLLLLGIKAVLYAPIACLFSQRIDIPLTFTVTTLLLLWIGRHMKCILLFF